MNRYSFTANEIEFYTEIKQDESGYRLQAFFNDGRPANAIVYTIRYKDNDDVKLYSGSPGVEHLLYAVVNTVK